MHTDILIIGAGVLGLSTAYHIKRENPEKRVTVIDSLTGPGQGNTAKSAGGYRNVLASEKNRALAESTIDWFFHLQNEKGYNLKLTKVGYMWLLSHNQYNKAKNVIDKMKNGKVELQILEKEELEKRIPDLVTEPDEDFELMGLDSIETGVLGARCGTIDTDALSRSIESEFLKLGGETRYNTTATRLILEPEKKLEVPGEPFVWQKTRIMGAETTKGEIRAEKTIVAAGVWSERLLDPIGFDSMMKPKKRVLFVYKDPKLENLINAKGFNEHGTIPVTHLPNAKIYMKPDLHEGSLWMACADGFGRRYGLEDDPQPERELYSENIYHALVKYLPCFENVHPINMWAGQRAVNNYDLIPVVAPAPGMIYVGAATGNGILKSDSLGRIAAALYKGEKEAELYGGRRITVSDLGVETRNIEREAFKI